MNHLLQVIDETYGFCVYAYIGSDRRNMRKLIAKEKFWNMENFDEFIKSLEGDSFAGMTTTLNYKDSAPMYFVYIPTYTDLDDLSVTLCHELGHVSHRVLTHRGWTDFVNEDVFHSYLYLHDSLVRRFLLQIRIKKKKSKKK